MSYNDVHFTLTHHGRLERIHRANTGSHSSWTNWGPSYLHPFLRQPPKWPFKPSPLSPIPSGNFWEINHIPNHSKAQKQIFTKFLIWEVKVLFCIIDKQHKINPRKVVNIERDLNQNASVLCSYSSNINPRKLVLPKDRPGGSPSSSELPTGHFAAVFFQVF